MKKNKKAETKVQAEESELLKSQLARALADYDNVVKRVDRERGEVQKIISARLVTRLLPVLDMLEAAMKHSNDPGLAIVLSQFKDVLKSEGFEEVKINAGDRFDASNSEVIDTVSGGEGEDGTIAEVLQSGWQYLDGSVVRHAKVKVFKKGLDN